MADRCRVFLYDKDGHLLIEPDASVGKLMWGLGDKVETTISIPLSTQGLNRYLVRMANQVYIQHEYLPDWGGVIWSPMEWKAGELVLHAQSAEIYLAGRVVHRKQGGKRDVGGIVFGILQDMERREDTPITIDSWRIEPGSVVKSSDIQRGEDIYGVLNGLAEKYGFEWWLEPQLSNGKPEYLFCWQKRRIAYRTDIELGENGNAEWMDNVRVVEKARLTTSYMEIKRSSGADSDINIVPTSDEDHKRYGLWEKAINVEDVSAGGEISQEVDRAMREDRPRRSVHFKALLGVTNLSKVMRPGSIHRFYAPGAGFYNNDYGMNTIVRIKQMAYSDDNGYLEAVADELSERDLELYD